MIGGLVRRAGGSRLLQGSAWILIGLGIQSALGFAFWVLGARIGTSAEVGRASALFTAIQFVNFASGLGLTVALARHATDASEEADRLFGWAILATVGSSIVGGLAYLAVSDTAATRLVSGSGTERLIFCAYTAGTSIGLLVDVRLMAARRWGWLVARIAIAGLVRLPLVPLDVDVSPDLWLYHLMLAPTAISGIVAAPLLVLIGAGGIRFRRPATLASVARYAGVNWWATLTSQAPQFLLPLLVAQSVAASVNASFFLAWTLTGLVFLLPAAISQVLLVEGSKEAVAADEASSAPGTERTREAMRFSLGLAVVAWASSLVIGPVVAAVFGDDYDRLARLLPLLMLAGIPWAYTSVRLSEARICKDQRATVIITATLGVGILVPAVLQVPEHGTSAATAAWLFGNVAGAVAARLTHRRA